MDNLEIWNKLKSVPDWAQKKIKGGRLNGMTDIKPQWRYQKMTEQFGMCGEGWNYSIDKTWTEEGSDGQICQFAEVTLRTMLGNGEWSTGIPAVGGSMLVAMEKNGLHTSDEAVKMAVTDALGTAMKMLGLAADIYMGGNHDSKYEGVKTTHSPVQKKGNPITDKQVIRLHAIGNSNGWDNDKIGAMLFRDYGLESSKDIQRSQYDEIVAKVEVAFEMQQELDDVPTPPRDFKTAMEHAPDIDTLRDLWDEFEQSGASAKEIIAMRKVRDKRGGEVAGT